MSVKAIINDDRVICGCCGALLFILKGYVDNVADYAEIKIKCKHKSQGKYCDTINIILL